MSKEFEKPPKWIRCDACMRNRGKANGFDREKGVHIIIDCPVCKGTGWEKVQE